MCTIHLYWGADRAIPGNPEKTRVGCWLKGHIIDVYDDGKCTEPPAPGTKGVFVHIPGLDKSYVLDYIQTETSGVKYRRVHKFDPSILPAAITDELDANREITLVSTTLSELRGWIRNQHTGLLEG